MRIAFYPTLKAPDHPVPSGDREMARLLVAALQRAGHAVEMASPLRSFSRQPDPVRLAALGTAAASEIARLLAFWRGPGQDRRPGLWFTYHLYYKAPDLIGPAIARALAIPYVVAEASHAQKRSRDAWAPWQAQVESALAAAAAVLCFTGVDRAGLQRLPGLKARLVDLPPFIDVASHHPHASGDGRAPVRLVTLAMMRHGVKLQSYRFLAQSLHLLKDIDWQLTIIGDGPARADVAAAFAGFAPGRIHWTGLVAPENLQQHLAQADLFLWPGIGEAYGLAYLEAQAAGLPVLALDCGGIAATLRAGETGLLIDELTPEAYARAARTLMLNHSARQAMGQAARRFVHEERNLDAAAAILNATLVLASNGS